MARARRVVICDDSRTYSAALKKFLEYEPGIEVVGAFESAEQMLPQLERLAPDLITMDLEMRGMGGVRAIERIMQESPRPILVLSTHAHKGSELAAEALAAGALEAMPKTGLSLAEPENVWATALRSRVKRLASVQLKRRPLAGRSPAAPVPPPHPDLQRPRRVIAIGASTGGPPALATVLGDLPADFSLPVLVVQHIAAGFAEGLVRWIDGRVPLPVGFAEAGEPARAGVWFAPDDTHLMLDHSMCFAVSRTERGPHRPSLDVLFESLPAAVGKGAVAVVLTGMGRDGSAGVQAIREAGGLVIAQDEASSVVFGMPKSAIDAGADVVLPLDDIGGALRTIGRVSQR